MDGITREPTPEERKDFENIGYREDKARDKFNQEIAKKMQDAIKKQLPFAEKACRDDFNDYYSEQVKASIRKNGYLNPADIKPIKIEWDKYSDTNNFELIQEGEQSDQNLTKHNPGLDVKVAFKKWKYKGYNNTYCVMESGPESILRARAKLKELESESPKTRKK